MEIFALNNNDLLKQAVLAIREHGEESESGNSEINVDGTRFIDGFLATVTDPCDRWLSVEGRNSSALAAIGETFWVLSGRDDINFLSRVLPRAANFSDDGKTWRAAYGPRLYAYKQLDSVLDRLRKNPNSRQAYLTIYDPAEDSDLGLAMSNKDNQPVTKDMVCNFALLFSIKNNALNLTVTNRSQDVLWGMSSINFIEFTILQELLAKMLGVEVGVYRLFSNNIHYYNTDISQKQLGKINADTGIWDFSSCHSPIEMTGIVNQDDLQSLFAGILMRLENDRPLDDIMHLLKFYGADKGLIRDMTYVLWCRLTGTLINMNNVGDLGLIRAICHSPVDRKFVDPKYQEGCA